MPLQAFEKIKKGSVFQKLSRKFAFVVWLVFVLPANMSQTARSNCDSKVLWLIAGNTLVSTLVATAIRFLVF